MLSFFSFFYLFVSLGVSRGAGGPWGGLCSCGSLCAMWDLRYPARDRTHFPYVGRQILHHWITREVQRYFYYIQSVG